ncbi:hypothetical protein CC2G_014458 [Coprinopsis cinerea AmutBmut pab1-1]|nr:hypothetical protein CC2G_014458 [Coprinopsis cinerea AmutBmut pab1-1]
MDRMNIHFRPFEDMIYSRRPASDHPVLGNYDLMAAIFFTFKGSKEGRTALFRASLASRSFKDPALDALWVDLESYIPLLRLLPRVEGHDNIYYFEGDITNSKFLEYARRVKTIVIPPYKEKISYSNQVFTRLATQLRGRPMLPQLVRLRIEDVDTTGLCLFPLLASPTIDAIEFCRESLSRPHLYRSVFPSMTTDLPGLKSVSLAHDTSSFNLGPKILSMLLEITTIQRLHFDLPGTYLNPDFLVEIGKRFKYLVELSLNISFHSGSSCPRSEATDVQNGLFPAMTSLHLTVRDAASCHFKPGLGTLPVELCPGFPPSFLSRLTSLTLYIPRRFASSSLVGLKEVFSQSPSLRRVELRQDDGADVHLSFEVVKSILSIPTITEVILDISSLNLGFCWGGRADSEISKLIDAAYSSSRTAPLRKLIFPCAMDERFTFRLLKYISRKAMGLEHLSIPLDSSAWSLSKHWETDLVSTSTIRHLEISDTRWTESGLSFEEHDNIARYLDRVCPNLMTLAPRVNSSGQGSNHQGSWKFIDRLRKKEKAIRIYGGPNVALY